MWEAESGASGQLTGRFARAYSHFPRIDARRLALFHQDFAADDGRLHVAAAGRVHER